MTSIDSSLTSPAPHHPSHNHTQSLQRPPLVTSPQLTRQEKQQHDEQQQGRQPRRPLSEQQHSQQQPSQHQEHPRHRDGRRPLLSAAQALQLAKQLYGIPCDAPPTPLTQAPTSQPQAAVVAAESSTAGGDDGVDGGGSSNSSGLAAPTSCVELPSYDDRNFLILCSHAHRRQQQGDQRQQQQQGGGSSNCGGSGRSGGGGRSDGSNGGGGGGGGGGMHVVLKVHNTQDSGRTAQLQAIDEAMLRLAAAGVLTNTPLRPVVGPTTTAVAAAAAAAAAAKTAAAVDVAGGDCAGAGVRCLVAAAQPDGEGVGTEGTRLPALAGPAAASASAASASAATCWAWLPCTTHGGTASPGQTTAASSLTAVENDVGSRPQEQEQGQEQQVLGQGPQHHWHVVRCLSYVPGRMLSSVPHLTPALLLSLGSLMGRVTAGLAGWQPAALLSATQGDWHPQSGAAVLRRVVPNIGAFDQDQRAMLLAVAEELEAAGPALADPLQLPRQVCHADANDDNVVVDSAGCTAVGLIDFGDMGFMPRVCEIAITITYSMLLALERPMVPETPTPAAAAAAAAFLRLDPAAAGAAVFAPSHSRCDAATRTPEVAEAAGTGAEAEGTAAAAVAAARPLAGGLEAVEAAKAAKATEAAEATEGDEATLMRLLAAAGLILAGYCQAVPLARRELALLPLLLRGRLAQSLTLGAASVVADPGNAAYLMQTQRPGWRVMRLLSPGLVRSEGEVLGQLLAAAGMEGLEA